MFVAVMFAGVFILGIVMEIIESQVTKQDDIVKFQEKRFSVLMQYFVPRLNTNKYFNPFPSNFSAYLILPSSYLFWAGKR
jgi:hypothetical protein